MLERRKGLFASIKSWFNKKNESDDLEAELKLNEEKIKKMVVAPAVITAPKKSVRTTRAAKKVVEKKPKVSSAAKPKAALSSKKKPARQVKAKVAPASAPQKTLKDILLQHMATQVQKTVRATSEKIKKTRRQMKRPGKKLPLPPFVVPDAPSPKHELQLHRYHKNPILEPKEKNIWESKATFNPAAMAHDGKVHLIYRAIGDNDESVLGYAVSHDGVTIHKRSDTPAYFQSKETRKNVTGYQVPYSSGGGWNGGCEDPRLTKIDDDVFLTYTAFDGWGSIRMALATISLEDFLKEKWDWSKPVFISPPGQVHKNWLLFPEKIKGKFAFLHTISPTVSIEYVSSLEKFDGTKFIESKYQKAPAKKGAWDSWVRGAGPPPIKTKHGWLLLYHAMDVKDPNRYKLGAMLLDLKDPTKILFRSHKPILEPDVIYENEGFKWGVVYSCGAVVMDKTLYVYYGGADRVACVAAANLEHFLGQLMGSGEPKLKRTAKK